MRHDQDIGKQDCGVKPEATNRLQGYLGRSFRIEAEVEKAWGLLDGLGRAVALLWGKAGQQSLARSALAEATVQLRRGLDQIATLPATLALRREQINFQVALISSLYHVKGFGAETTAAVERANLLIEQAIALGEPPEDPLLLFLVLYGFWNANRFPANSNLCRELAERTLTLAEKQKAPVPLHVAHRMMASSLLLAGALAQSRTHLDQALTLYDPVEHRSLAMRFGLEPRALTLTGRSLVLWLLGHPESALADAEEALRGARVMAHAPTSLWVLSNARQAGRMEQPHSALKQYH